MKVGVCDTSRCLVKTKELPQNKAVRNKRKKKKGSRFLIAEIIFDKKRGLKNPLYDYISVLIFIIILLHPGFVRLVSEQVNLS